MLTTFTEARSAWFRLRAMLRRFRIPMACVALVTVAACYVAHNSYYCNTHDDCTKHPDFPWCDTTTHACSQRFLGNGDMGDVDGGDMTPPKKCQMASDCNAARPVCGGDGLCTVCGVQGMSTVCSTSYPDTPLCGAEGGCVQCNSKDDCESDSKTCDSMTNSCVPCKDNAECTSGLCSAGVCAPQKDLIYVKFSDGCSDAGTGLLSMPFCSLQTGLNAGVTANKTVVVFPGGRGPYDEHVQASTTLVSVNSYKVTAVGVSNPTIKPSTSGAALSVVGFLAKTTDVTFDGFVFDSGTLNDMASDTVDCTGGGAAFGLTKLKITRSTIKGAPAIGLSSQSSCSTTLDADLFFNNAKGGLSFTASNFALTNLLIRNNGTADPSGSAFGGLSFGGGGEAGKMTAFNLTVVNNKARSSASGAAGISCGAPPT